MLNCHPCWRRERLCSSRRPRSPTGTSFTGPSRHCRVVERYVPGEDHTIVRVGPLRFGTRDEAEHEISTVCHDNGYYREEHGMREEHKAPGGY